MRNDPKKGRNTPNDEQSETESKSWHVNAIGCHENTCVELDSRVRILVPQLDLRLRDPSRATRGLPQGAKAASSIARARAAVAQPSERDGPTIRAADARLLVPAPLASLFGDLACYGVAPRPRAPGNRRRNRGAIGQAGPHRASRRSAEVKRNDARRPPADRAALWRATAPGQSNGHGTRRGVTDPKGAQARSGRSPRRDRDRGGTGRASAANHN
jgi:hypothetical protein